MLFPQIPNGHIEPDVGEHEVVLGPNYHGLNYFPDEPPVMLQAEGRVRYLLTAVNRTVLMEGKTLETATPAGIVFKPGAGFDNGYAGITSVYRDRVTNVLFGFYHAEDQRRMPKAPYNTDVPLGYWSIGIAKSVDDARRFTSIAQILRSSATRDQVTEDHRGIGDPCVVETINKDYLYAYYTDLTRRETDMRASISLARCKPSEATSSASWQKFYNGGFTEPSMGGNESPVVRPLAAFQGEVIQPHVTPLPKWGKYIMVFCVVSQLDLKLKEATEGGIFMCHSDDGVDWTEPRRLFKAIPIPLWNKQFSAHPSLLLETSKTTPTKAEGWLLYCYSEKWGTQPPNVPHYLARRRITLTLSAKERSPCVCD